MDDNRLGEGLLPHLIELRNRLLRSVLSIVVVFLLLCIFPGTHKIYDLLAYPLLSNLPSGDKMIALGVVTPFLVPIKVTLFASLVIALPYVLYQLWAFLAPGLYKNERQLVLPVLIMSYTLFLIGISFCYFFVFKLVFRFIISISPESIQFAPDIEAYVSFVFSLFLAFGITFEVPVIVVLLVYSGITTVDKLKEVRSYIIVLAFIVAAVLTPPDVLSQVLMAIPLILLYEIGIIIARFYTKKRTIQS